MHRRLHVPLAPVDHLQHPGEDVPRERRRSRARHVFHEVADAVEHGGLDSWVPVHRDIDERGHDGGRTGVGDERVECPARTFLHRLRGGGKVGGEGGDEDCLGRFESVLEQRNALRDDLEEREQRAGGCVWGDERWRREMEGQEIEEGHLSTKVEDLFL